MLSSVQSAHTLRVNELLEAENNHNVETHADSYGWFTPAAKYDEAVSFHEQ